MIGFSTVISKSVATSEDESGRPVDSLTSSDRNCLRGNDLRPYHPTAQSSKCCNVSILAGDPSMPVRDCVYGDDLVDLQFLEKSGRYSCKLA